VTCNTIVVLPDDDRIDKPAPTNDCEQLVALFIRVRAAFRFVGPSFLSGPHWVPEATAVKVTCTFATRKLFMDEDPKKFSES
jgi:hypothetical protein